MTCIAHGRRSCAKRSLLSEINLPSLESAVFWSQRDASSARIANGRDICLKWQFVTCDASRSYTCVCSVLTKIKMHKVKSGENRKRMRNCSHRKLQLNFIRSCVCSTLEKFLRFMQTNVKTTRPFTHLGIKLLLFLGVCFGKGGIVTDYHRMHPGSGNCVNRRW